MYLASARNSKPTMRSYSAAMVFVHWLLAAALLSHTAGLIRIADIAVGQAPWGVAVH